MFLIAVEMTFMFETPYDADVKEKKNCFFKYLHAVEMTFMIGTPYDADVENRSIPGWDGPCAILQNGRHPSWGAYISTKEPYISKKEPYISTKEPYIPTKEPYISAKEPCISTKSPMYLQESPSYPLTSWGALHLCRIAKEPCHPRI